MPTAIDITGQQHGYLMPHFPSTKKCGGNIYWWCECLFQGPGCVGWVEVGTDKIRRKKHATVSCGCFKRWNTAVNINPLKKIDCTGMRISYLLGEEEIGMKEDHYLWRWKCLYSGLGCIGFVDATYGELTRAESPYVSCGCFRRSWLAGAEERNVERGLVKLIEQRNAIASA